MPLIEGVGDEVTEFFVALIIVLVGGWLSLLIIKYVPLRYCSVYCLENNQYIRTATLEDCIFNRQTIKNSEDFEAQ